MKKILIMMPSMFIGGAERSLLGLLDAIDYQEYSVDLFLYRHEGEFLSYIPEQVHLLPKMDSYGTFDVPIADLIFSKKVLFGVSRVASKIAMKAHCLFSGEKPGVWMAMQFTSQFLQWLLPKVPGKYDAAISFLGIPDTLINKVNAPVKLAWNHTDYTTLGPCHSRDRKLYNKIDYVVSVSDQCEEQFLQVYPDLKGKSAVIENILSPSLVKEQSMEVISETLNRSGPVLVSIGRYSDAKNFDNVPDICKQILNSGLNVTWYIIGYGGDEPLIRQKIAESHMEDHVILLGKKENPYPYIRACDLYVQPSRYEGKSVTVREAQMLGKPVVITRYATSASQLEDGMDGVIVPMDNEGCANGIAELLRDPQRMELLRQNCGERDYSNRGEVEKLYQMMK